MVLDRRVKASALVGYPVVPATASRAALRKAVAKAEGQFPIADLVSEKVSATNMWAVADFVLGLWKSARNHAFVTQPALTAGLSMSTRTVQRAVAGLQQAGLFGVITGTEGRASQFYPLFHAPSLGEFRRVLGLVQVNINEDIPAWENSTVGDMPDWAKGAPAQPTCSPKAPPIHVPAPDPETLANLPDLVSIAITVYLARAGESDMNALAHYFPHSVGLDELQDPQERSVLVRQQFLMTRSEPFFQDGASNDAHHWAVRYAAVDFMARYDREKHRACIPMDEVEQEHIEALARAGLFAPVTDGENVLLFPLFQRTSRTALCWRFGSVRGMDKLEQLLTFHPLAAKPSITEYYADNWQPVAVPKPTRPWKKTAKRRPAAAPTPERIAQLQRMIDRPPSSAFDYDTDIAATAQPTIEEPNAKDLRLLDGALRNYAQKASRLVPLLSPDDSVEEVESSLRNLSISDLEFLVAHANPERLPMTLAAALYIAGRFDAATGTCVVSFADIADSIDCSRSKVAPTVDLLRDAGLFAYVRSVKRNGAGTFIPLFHSRGVDALEAAITALRSRRA